MTTHRSAKPLVSLVARPSPNLPGRYDGAFYVHAKDESEASAVFRSAWSRPELEGVRFFFHTMRYGPKDIVRRDPRRTTVYADFDGASKAAIDALRKTSDASLVGRSKKDDLRSLTRTLFETRAPLSVPTKAMWRAAVEADGDVNTADWMLDRIFEGWMEPSDRRVEMAYRLMDEENARRAKMR